MKYSHGGETDMEPTTAPTAPDYGEYGGVIETIKKFAAFITDLIKKVMDFLKGIFNKKDDNTGDSTTGA